MTDKPKPFEFAGQMVEIPRLTVVQMCEAMTGDEAYPENISLLGSMLFEDMTLAQLVRITGLELAAVEDSTPAELEKLINRILEENPHWAGARRRIIEYGRRLQSNPIED